MPTYFPTNLYKEINVFIFFFACKILTLNFLGDPAVKGQSFY